MLYFESGHTIYSVSLSNCIKLEKILCNIFTTFSFPGLQKHSCWKYFEIRQAWLPYAVPQWVWIVPLMQVVNTYNRAVMCLINLFFKVWWMKITKTFLSTIGNGWVSGEVLTGPIGRCYFTFTEGANMGKTIWEWKYKF